MKRALALACLALAAVSFADPWDDERKDLLVKLRDPDVAPRMAAIRALKEHRSARGIDFLVELFLAEKEPRLAEAIGDTIGGVVDGEGRDRFFAQCKAARKTEDRAKLIALL